MKRLDSVAHIVVAEHPVSKQKEYARYCLLGKDIEIDLTDLASISSLPLSRCDWDLTTVVAAIIFADRAEPRRFSSGWARHFRLQIPVYEVERWRDEPVVQALSDALAFSTGDFWEFDFRRRLGELRRGFQRRIPPTPSPVVLPFSGGLDSYATLELLRAKSNVPPLLVTAVHNNALLQRLRETTRPHSAVDDRIRLPVRGVAIRHPEPSYRTRTFLFFVVASLACRLMKGEQVVIPENGQGSVGVSMVPLSGEHPYQGIHPGYTARLRKFLSFLWGEQAPRFEHPHLWKTKSELLEELVGVGGFKGVSATRSCSRSVSRHKDSSENIHCGICDGCLLRRISLRCSGLDKLEEEYFWSDLNVDTLDQGINPHYVGSKRTTLNDIQIAEASVLAEQHLSQMSDLPARAPERARCVHEISRALLMDKSVIEGSLQSLLSRHKQDWECFLDFLGPRSWVRSLVGAN